MQLNNIFIFAFNNTIFISAGDELENLEVKIGNVLSISGTTIDTSSFTTCATFPGPSIDGATESIVCSPPVIGSVLVLEKTVTTNQLTLCEVEVYSSIGK